MTLTAYISLLSLVICVVLIPLCSRSLQEEKRVKHKKVLAGIVGIAMAQGLMYAYGIWNPTYAKGATHIAWGMIQLVTLLLLFHSVRLTQRGAYDKS